MLTERLAGTGLSVRWEGGSRFLGRGRTVKLVPDMIIEDDSGPVCIADAKYKRTGYDPDAGDEQTTGAASSADVYQMLAYCIGYGVSDAVLVHAEPAVRETIEIPVDGRLVRVHSLGIDLTGDGGRSDDECRLLSRRLTEIAIAAATGE